MTWYLVYVYLVHHNNIRVNFSIPGIRPLQRLHNPLALNSPSYQVRTTKPIFILFHSSTWYYIILVRTWYLVSWNRACFQFSSTCLARPCLRPSLFLWVSQPFRCIIIARHVRRYLCHVGSCKMYRNSSSGGSVIRRLLILCTTINSCTIAVWWQAAWSRLILVAVLA